MGEQGSFLAILVPMPMRRDAVAIKIAFDPIDQPKIAVPADSWKTDQPIKNLAW
jgi:hypothetical protein